MEAGIYKYNEPFVLESGKVLPSVTIAYHTYGEFDGSNAVWVCHALTANSEVADWWPGTVEKGRFLNPELNYIVCANILGSHYGTTGPLSDNPDTGMPYYGEFPEITIRDMVNVHMLLARHLGIGRIKVVMGSSIGGFQAMEMAVMNPDIVESLVLIATSAVSQPWAIAFNESQRMAIETDPTFGREDPRAGLEGMGVARSIALLSYRGWNAYNKTQQDPDVDDKSNDFRVSSYQRYQAEKLEKRFNAYSYHRLTKAFDSHNVGRRRGGAKEVLGKITCPVLLVGITTDIIFPPSDQEFLNENIPGSRLHIIDSDFGHDGFLVESDKLNDLLNPFVNSNNKTTHETP